MTGCRATSSFYGNQIKKTGSHVNIRVWNISVQDEAYFLFAIYKSIYACVKNDNRERCEKRFIRYRLSFLSHPLYDTVFQWAGMCR